MLYLFVMVIAGLVAANFFGFLSLDVLLFLLFLLSIAVFIYAKRREVKREGVIIIHRTRKGVNAIDKIAKKHPRLWRFLATAGIFVSTLAMVFGAFVLLDQAYKIFTGASKTGGVGLLLPGPAATPVALPGLFIVPWWIWVIGVGVVMFPHEIAHGIVCRLEKIRIKSVGWLFLLFLPGAFVEPDEAQLKRAKRSTKLKVYAAGSFANIIVAFLLLLLLGAWFSLAFTQKGVSFLLINGTPAHLANLTGSIVEIDGARVATHEEISASLDQKKPGDSVTIKTLSTKEIIPVMKLGFGINSLLGGGGAAIQGDKEKTYTITLAEHPQKPGKAMLGVAAPMPAGSFASPVFLYIIVFWAFLFSIAIGIVNLLPIKPLDGGLLFEELTGALTKNNALLVKAVTTLMILVLLFNLLGPLVVG